jgi:fatty acid desaturase 2 (delta-6 desaturase)
LLLQVFLTYVGEDATDAYSAFHKVNDKDMKASLDKYLKPMLVAPLSNAGKGQSSELHESTHDANIETDFRRLRKDLEDAGMFKADWRFYAAMLAHIILLEVAAWYTLSTFGTGWLPYCSAVVMLVVAQAQAGWLQHDFGHLSVFKSRDLNLLAHKFVILHLKAASSAWWNYRCGTGFGI